MNRARIHLAATIVGIGLLVPGLAAQKAPDFKPILAGKKFEPPLKGQAEVEFTQPVSKRDKDKVVTTIKVKNVSKGPLARLTIDETWFDKSGAIVAGSKGVVPQLLQPGEVQTVTIETPWNAKMNGNGYNFSHANGTVKPKKVASFDQKEPAAKTAAASKKKK